MICLSDFIVKKVSGDDTFKASKAWFPLKFASLVSAFLQGLRHCYAEEIFSKQTKNINTSNWNL